jgi:uncharacterized protein (DUF58 family)
MTRNGMIVALVGAAALAAGLGLGYPAGLATAVVCGAALLAGLPIRPLPGRPLDVALTVTPVTAARGATATVEVAARGPVVVGLRAGGLSATVDTRWETPPLRRGRYPVTVERVFAVGSLALWKRPVRFASRPAELTVCPRHVELARPPDMIRIDEDGPPARTTAGTGAAFAGLREYTPGDDLRQIDWAASARSGDGEVYVRQFAPALTEECVVVLDLGADDPEAFEVAVDLAYSFVLAGADLAIVGEPEPVRGAGSAREALIRLTPGTPPVTGTPGSIGAAVVITASRARGDQLRRAYGRAVPVIVTGSDLAAAARQWAR